MGLVVARLAAPRLARRLGRALLRAPSDYRVVVGAWLAGALCTWWARRTLGPSPAAEEVARWGFGLPAVLEGRPWALVTGMLLIESLKVPLPLFTLVGIGLYENRASHRRAATVLVAGQLVGVLVVCALLVPFRHGDWAWARHLAAATDFGISVGGFATLGAWTAHLPGVWRRRARAVLSCYFVGPLLLSGLIYDLSHPAGWATGLVLGAVLAPGSPHPPDRTRRQARETTGLVVSALVGAAIGFALAVQGGGNGGPFGWGPGA